MLGRHTDLPGRAGIHRPEVRDDLASIGFTKSEWKYFPDLIVTGFTESPPTT